MPTFPSSAKDLLTQLTTGPSLREVAAATLRSSLRELYPDLDIDPDLALLITPGWQITAEVILPGTPHAQSLTGALSRCVMSNTTVTWIDGEHYLIYQTTLGPNVHLPVKVDTVGSLINELAPLLPVAYQEQQLLFWNQSPQENGPRWQSFANALRRIWNIESVEGWDEDECNVARNVFLYPDYADRQLHDKYNTKAYLIDIDVQQATQVSHSNLAALAVLIGRLGEREIILSYSIGTGYAAFNSQKEFGESLSTHGAIARSSSMHWRLFEPAGNFFEQQACTFIALQIQAIGAVTFENGEVVATVAQAAPSNTVDLLSLIAPSRLDAVHHALPTWLLDASPTDQSAYGRYSMDVAAQHFQDAGKAFDDGIKSIDEFALDAIHTLMLTEHPEVARATLNNVRITITSVQAWGTLIVPGNTQIQTLTLAQLALENLIALPLGNKTVSYKNGSDVPAWMTAAYLEALITQANVGERYPALVKRTLLDDPVESLRRQQLYIAHLRLQLPLLALQCKVQHVFGVSEQGYRYVCAALSPDSAAREVDGAAIVIRPLSLRPKLRLTASVDVVSNMFIIGPQDPKKGPCLLYRPLSDVQLMEFPSPSNLLYAIKQDTPLRQSVLAWLPDNVRTAYAQFVFPGSLPSPWVLTSLVNDPLNALVMTGPIDLGQEVLRGDYFATLFKANAAAMVTLADRQSLSNAEARWQSLKNAGWLIFNTVLPFMGRSVGAATWIWQLMDDLQQMVDAKEIDDRTTGISALVDIFLTLGMVLATHVATRLGPGSGPAIEKPGVLPKLPPPAAKPELIQKPTVDGVGPPIGHEHTLHISGAITRNSPSLGTFLDSFTLPKPDKLGEQHTVAGPYLNLYAKDQHWYAPVGERWFEVIVDENDAVLIVDPQQPGRHGPLLIGNQLGQWFVDTRLRLRGAGLRSRRKKGEALRPPKIADLRQKLELFENTRAERTASLEKLRSAIDSAADDAKELARATFLEQIDTRLKEIDVPISQLKSLKIIDTVPNYQDGMASYLKHQLLLARSAIYEQGIPFRKQLQASQGHFDIENIQEDTWPTVHYRDLYTATQAMIDRLEYVRERREQALDLGALGAELVQSDDNFASGHDVDDLKAFKVSLSHFLCVTEGESPSRVDAREALRRIVDAAELTVQSFREAVQPVNVAPLEQLIETLDSLTDQFSRVDQNLVDLPAEFPTDLNRPDLENLRTQVDEFAQRAKKQLTALLRERKTLEPTPGPSNAASRVKRKYIKTRSKGIVVGEQRETPAEDGKALVDVKEPMTGKVIATFHEKEPGVWVEQEQVLKPGPRTRVRDLQIAINSGLDLIDGVDAFITRKEAWAKKTAQLPVEIEESFHRHAKKLEQASLDIEDALTASNLTGIDSPSAALTSRNLDEAGKKLYREGKRVKIDVLKRRPPEAAHIEILLHEGAVTVDPPVGERIKLRGRDKGYLREYTVVDATTKLPLWYAHFHYPTPTGPNEAYTAAHLKTHKQRKMGGQRESLSDIAVYRREIGPQLARSLFLKAKPPQPVA